MDHEPGRPRRHRAGVVLLVLALVAMLAAGLVLASDFVVPWPPAVVIGAALVAGAGLVAAFVIGWRQARRSGVGLFRATGRAIRATVRVAVDLFF